MDNLLNETPPKQDAVPDKFLDAKTGAVRTDALLKSYLELEKKLAQAPASSLPKSPQDYSAVTISHEMFTHDDEINKRLFEKGFTVEQAQFLYDLAAEYMVPLVLDIAAEFEAERQLEKLVHAFGGAERWAEISRQLLAYGRKNLPPEVLGGLSGSFEGVMALYKMMQSSKPLAVQGRDETPAIDQDTLRAMMKDPKYWRDKDAAFVKKVSDGFRQVFSEQR